MAALLLDTNVVSYLMKGHTLAERYRAQLEGRILAISFMTVAELLEGALRRNWGSARRRVLEGVIGSYVVIPSTPGICRRWAEVRFARRRQPVSAQDAWIAATALELGCLLVTHNRDDFRDIPGLNLLVSVQEER